MQLREGPERIDGRLADGLFSRQIAGPGVRQQQRQGQIPDLGDVVGEAVPDP